MVHRLAGRGRRRDLRSTGPAARSPNATAADGSYSISNVLAGAQKISITPPAGAAGASPDPSNPDAYKAMMMGKGIKGAAPEKPPFPQRYQSAQDSGLTFTVNEGPNTFDIDLKE